MAIPAITFKINPNGVATTQPSVSQVALIMGMSTSGPCSGQIGVSSPVQSFGSETVVSATYGSGALPELVNGLLQAGATQVLACRIFSGTLGSTVIGGSNTSTAVLSFSGSPMGPYGAAVAAGITGGPIVKVSTSSGVSTPGQIQISLDGGNTYCSPQVATTAAFLIPNTGISISFSAVTGSGVMVLGDKWNVNITATAGSIGTVSQQNLVAGGPQGIGGVSVYTPTAAGPADQYEIVVQILSSGTLGTGTFKYSLDGGNTFSSALAIPSSGTYTVGEAGEVALAFSNPSASLFIGSATSPYGITFTAVTPGNAATAIQVAISMSGGAGTTATAAWAGNILTITGKTSATITTLAAAVTAATGTVPLGGVTATVVGLSTDVGAAAAAASLTIATATASLFLVSTTSPDGVTFTAVNSGSAANALQVAISMTGGSGTTATAAWAGNILTITGKTSATNTAIAGSVATATGTVPLGGVTAAVTAGGTDIGVTTAATNLTGGRTTGAGTGVGFQANDQYVCPVTGPYYTTTDYTNVMAQVLASPTQFGFIHLTGRPATAANAYTVAGFVDAQMSTALSKNRFIRTLMEMPPNLAGNGDAAAIAAFTNPNLPSLRVSVGCGDVNFTTPDGLQLQRCCSWSAAAVAALVRPGQDLAWVGAGGIADTADILRDESVLVSLDQYGFITTRTWFGKQGYYFTSAQTMGALGTNFQYLALGRVMDEACTACYQALLPYVNQGLLANPTTGLIDPRQAAEINNDCNVAMYNALNLAQAASGGADASGAQAMVDQSANIASTGILPVTVAVVALLYGRQITVTAGFALKLATL